MSLSNSFIAKAGKEIARFALSFVPDSLYGSSNPYKRVTDLNKEAGRLTLQMHGVYSSNIPAKTMNDAQRIMAAKQMASISTVLNLVLSRIRDAKANGDSVSTADAIKSALANNDATRNMNFHAQTVADKAKLGESLQIVFNENSLCSRAKLSEARDSGADVDAGSYIVMTMNIRQSTQDETLPNLTFNFKIGALPIESSKLVETIGTTKDRNILFNYFKMRAGNGSFWKDFVLNLKEIDKEVQRNTSDSLEDRLLASMMRKGGFLVPEYFSDVGEMRHYILYLERSDVDAMKSKYGFDIKKPNALRLMFERYSILSLVIVDTIEKNLVIYDSDNPLQGFVISTEKASSGDRDLYSLFNNIMRS